MPVIPPAEHDGIRDLIIIGSGPAGYAAAVYAARANLHPLVFEGSQFGGALMTTTEVENFPGFREGIQGPQLMDDMRGQAERFGAELVPRDVTEVDLTANPKVVMVGDEAAPRARRHRGHRLEVPVPGPGQRVPAARPRRLGLRHLRRVLLPRPGHRGRRRRRLRDGGGHLPHPVRQERHRRAPPRGAARLEDHAEARAGQREDPLGPGQAGHRRDRRDHGRRRSS